MAFGWGQFKPKVEGLLTGLNIAQNIGNPVKDWLYRGAGGIASNAAQRAAMIREADSMKWSKALGDDAYKWMGGSGKHTYKPGGNLNLWQLAKTGGTPASRKLYQTLSRFAGPVARLGGTPLLAAQMLGKEAGQEKLFSRGAPGGSSGWQQSMVDPTFRGLPRDMKGGLISEATVSPKKKVTKKKKKSGPY